MMRKYSIYRRTKNEIFPEPHLHNSGESTRTTLRCETDYGSQLEAKQCTSIQLHQLNWVLKISLVPTVVLWPGAGKHWYLYLLGVLISELEKESETHYPEYPRVGFILTLKENLKPSEDVKDFKALLWDLKEHSWKQTPADSLSHRLSEKHINFVSYHLVLTIDPLKYI